MIASEIRWGTGFDNILSFDHPQSLDEARTFRRPAPGSRRMRSPAGVTDAWINRRDFCLAGRARYFARPAWSGLGLQDFLDWASEGNTFRFVPDNRYPSFYVDNCYLEEPFDDPQPQLEQSDGSQSIDVVIRQQAFDFGLALRGLLFEYAPGKSLTDPSSAVATFARGSTARRYARDLSLATDAAGVLRDRHFEAAKRTTLLERTATNRCLHSEDASNAAWTKNNITVDANLMVAPDGVQSADRLTATATGATEMHQNGGAAAAGAVYTVSMFVSQGVGNVPFMWVGDRGDAAYHRAWINLDTGALATQSNCTARVIPLADYPGWYRVEVMFTRTNAGTIQPSMGICDADGGTSCTINRYGFWWGAQDEAGPPTSYIATAGATVARSDDALSFPFTWPLQDVTVYADIAALAPYQYNQILNIGADADGLELYNHATLFFAEIRGTSTVTVSGGTPALGSRVQLCAQYKEFATGPKVRLDAGSGFGAFSAGGNARNVLGAQTLRLGDGSNGKTRMIAVSSLKVAAGLKTLTEMASA